MTFQTKSAPIVNSSLININGGDGSSTPTLPPAVIVIISEAKSGRLVNNSIGFTAALS